MTDADGDTLAYTFSIRRAGAAGWTDLAVDIRDTYVQFDISSLADGLYRTRLVAAEQAPRPEAQRLRVEFQTDDLLVDNTPPEILDAAVRREGAILVVTVHGRDALSLLDGAEFDFNNGYHEVVLHPVDGILDGREETFELRTPAQNVTGATAVEIHLADQPGKPRPAACPCRGLPIDGVAGQRRLPKSDPARPDGAMGSGGLSGVPPHVKRPTRRVRTRPTRHRDGRADYPESAAWQTSDPAR